MPIGDQIYGNVNLNADKLKQKYDCIIKEALQKADPNLEIFRADEELNPNSISNDIFTKLMHSKYVVADITYPNPNVFYELGLRHAIRTGTMLIREKIDLNIPFDISHLRYIEYTQEVNGMNELSQKFKHYFDYYKKNPQKPDNQFLELCSLTKYAPICYADKDKQFAFFGKVLSMLFKHPDLMQILSNSELSDQQKQQQALTLIAQNSDQIDDIVSSMMESGFLNI